MDHEIFCWLGIRFLEPQSPCHAQMLGPPKLNGLAATGATTCTYEYIRQDCQDFVDFSKLVPDSVQIYLLRVRIKATPRLKHFGGLRTQYFRHTDSFLGVLSASRLRDDLGPEVCIRSRGHTICCPSPEHPRGKPGCRYGADVEFFNSQSSQNQYIPHGGG